MQCVVGLDIGTTSTIGILIALPDRTLATVSRPVTLHSPHQGWAEEDPQQWWDNVCAIVPQLIAEAGVRPADVKAVGVTGMLPAVVLLDDVGSVLRPSIQQSDGRCGEEVAEMQAELDEADFIAKAGNGINQQLVTAKLRWIARHEPKTFDRIATVFGSYDYINWRLTGERCVERNWALEAGFTDVAGDRLDDSLIELAGIPRSAIARRVDPHEVIGAVTGAAAAQTGLVEGTPVVGGAADHIASAYAAGIVAPGDILLKFGGATDVMIATDKAVPDPRIYLDYHLIPGLFMPNGCMASGGSALNWFVREMGADLPAASADGISPHAYLDRRASETPPGADGVQIVPYFLGEKTPVHDAQARGTITGLSLNHGKGHLWRALLEGFGYAIRHHVRVFNDLGYPTTRFLASDGGAQSELWMQIVADILQEPVQLLTGHPGSSLGAAWMAAIGAGFSDDWDGPQAFVGYGRRIEPDRTNADLYDSGYRRFRETYQALAAMRGRNA